MEKQIITFAFDNFEDIMKLDKYLSNEQTLIYVSKKNYVINPRKFALYITDLTKEDNEYYLLLDEIQLLDNFVFVLLGNYSRLA